MTPASPQLKQAFRGLLLQDRLIERHGEKLYWLAVDLAEISTPSAQMWLEEFPRWWFFSRLKQTGLHSNPEINTQLLKFK